MEFMQEAMFAPWVFAAIVLETQAKLLAGETEDRPAAGVVVPFRPRRFFTWRRNGP